MVPLVLFLVFNILSETLPLNIGYFFSNEKSADLKVLTYNVHSRDSNFVNVEKNILQQVLNENADVAYLAECYTKEAHYLDSVLKKRYPVSYNMGVLTMDKLYSRWSIDTIETLKVDTLSEKYQKVVSARPELRSHFKYSMIYKTHVFADKDTLTLICCHLESSNVYKKTLSKDNYKYALENAYLARALEADAIFESIKDEDHPVVVMGDFNDISGSYTLRRIQSAGLRDAWWMAGIGYGRTFHQGYLNLRLDHILYSPKHLKPLKVKVIDNNNSDHNALTASFRFKYEE